MVLMDHDKRQNGTHPVQLYGAVTRLAFLLWRLKGRKCVSKLSNNLN